MVRVILPHHLRNLAQLGPEIAVNVESPVSVSRILGSIEQAYPVLRGTIRDHGTLKRRPFLRFFACGEDISLDSPDAELPETISNGSEPFLVVGAIAGG